MASTSGDLHGGEVPVTIFDMTNEQIPAVDPSIIEGATKAVEEVENEIKVLTDAPKGKKSAQYEQKLQQLLTKLAETKQLFLDASAPSSVPKVVMFGSPAPKPIPDWHP